MPSKPDPARELADRLLQTLQAQRGQGPAAYPLTLRRLAELADPQAPPELVLKAAAKPSFRDQAVVAKKKDLAAPVALRDDLPQLAASPLLLEFLLEALCTPEQPAWGLDKLQKKLDADLRQPFADAVARRLHHNTLPPGIATVTLNDQPR